MTVMTDRTHSDLQIKLRTHDLLDVHDGQGLAVSCLDGVIWITQSNDFRDIVVRAGEFFALDRNGLALVAAPLGPATITIGADNAKGRPVAPDQPTIGALRVAA
jgi:hypothetical protein